MSKKQKVLVGLIAVLMVGTVFYFTSGRKMLRKAAPIKLSQQAENQGEALNPENRSPISGVECASWRNRAVAVMQPSDIQARPAAGFSEADMVIEMPAYTASNTRLMGVYICNIPEEIGAIRSGRHDNIHLAKGLDAIFVHWGYSIFAENLLNKKIIDNINCLASPYCDRREATGQMRLEDTGRITRTNTERMLNESGYRKENNFSGYPHQAEAPVDQRPAGGNLRVAFADPYDVEYEYDQATNSYLRIWGNKEDFDRNNNKRIAPKNIVVMMAKSEQITLDQDYVGKGLQDPWAEVPEIKKTGIESINSRYNNVQIGDPWYDDTDSGEAFYYFNGQEYKGTWKKDRSKIDSKLFFYDQAGKEIRFVPGQIWVEILEPGQRLKWEPRA